MLGIDTDNGLYLLLHLFRIGRRQVDLVQYWHDFEAHFDGRVAVRHGLGFHTLRRIHDQQRALAGSQRTADLVTEVDVARSVDEIEHVDFSVARRVRQRHRLRLDRDPALALDRIRIEHLRLHLARFEAAAQLDDAVGQRGLAVVHVRDDGEIADVVHALPKSPAGWPMGYRQNDNYRMNRR